MVLLNTPDVDNSFNAVDFSLRGTDDKLYTLNDVKGEKGLVIMFISNHCPYVKAIQSKLVRDMQELQQIGVNSIAIASNDTSTYPEDDMPRMKEIATELGYPFPYVLDESQDVARSYDAVCTPDFFGFDSDLILRYRGRLDDSGMQVTENRHRDLFEAMKQVAETGEAPTQQFPSMGCSIKWKNEAY